ncbi:hypothetical protein ACHAXH_002384 [Discostella pseudostelligera]|jgi:hypothetical protein
MKTAAINVSVMTSDSMVNSSMMTSSTAEQADETLETLVTAVGEAISTGVSTAIDNVSALSSNDVVLLARSLSWSIESLAKSTEAMVFPRQAEEEIYKKQVKQVMKYQQMAHEQYCAAVAKQQQEEEENKKKKWMLKRNKESKEEKKPRSVLMCMAQDALRRNKSAKSTQAKKSAVLSDTTNKSAPERKSVKPLKAHNR